MMKKILILAITLVIFGRSSVSAQRVRTVRCGLPELQAAMIAKDSSWAQKFAAQKANMQGIADNYIAMKKSGALERTTATTYAIPVIFHFILDSAQFFALGGTYGIQIRCDSQIAVLNRDFNQENADSAAIPSSWQPLRAATGIHFGLAMVDPAGNCASGYEIKIIPGTGLDGAGFDNAAASFPEAKMDTTGLPSWDVNRYFNVWCVNFTGGASGILGLTEPVSFLYPSTMDQEGVVMLYSVVGCTAPDGTPPANTGGAAGWFYPYNLGRTLTHEAGHMFEIWHPWGDDGGLCPWSGGADDGLSDTPPESNYTYGAPGYTIAGGTFNDGCEMNGSVNTQPIGIACLSFMEYVDDDAMHLFTPMQAAAMASMVLVPPTGAAGATGSGTVGENYNLTQHPELLIPCVYPDGTAAAPAQLNSGLNIYPNPARGQVTLIVNSTTETLNEIVIINLLGQQVMTISGQNKDLYQLDLSDLSKGVYFIQCNFASGSVTRKIVLQ